MEVTRNRKIYEEWLKGKTVKELAEKYSVSTSRISDICKREKQKDEYKVNDVYKLIISLCEDEKFCTKTFRVLLKMGVTSEEEIVKLDREILRKTRHCGVVMEELIMRMKELIENRE